jgi:hypothetical protein
MVRAWFFPFLFDTLAMEELSVSRSRPYTGGDRALALVAEEADPNLVSAHDDVVVRQDFSVDADGKPEAERTAHLRREPERSPENTAKGIVAAHGGSSVQLDRDPVIDRVTFGACNAFLGPPWSGRHWFQLSAISSAVHDDCRASHARAP